MADTMEPAQQPATATWEQAFGYLQHCLNEAATQQQTAQSLMQQQLMDLTTALTNFTKNQIPHGFSGVLHQEEEWLSLLCSGLLGPQCDHSEEQVPSPTHFGACVTTPWCKVLH
jgi:hypothetical protein